SDRGQANWAFFPLYPMLARLVSQATGASSFVSLLLVAHVAFIAALLVAWTEARDLYGRRAADACVLLLCLIPGTHFYSSAYSESLFLLCCLSALALARRRYWVAAGAAAALATLTRNIGIILVVPILLYFIQSPQSASLRERFLSLRVADVLPLFAGLSLPVIALGGYMAYLHALTGDALAFVHVQAAWGRKFTSPLVVLLFPDGDLAYVPSHIAAWISLALIGVLLWRRNWPHAAYAALCVTIFLTAGILSFMRLALSIAPLLLVGGDLIAARPRVGVVVLCCSAVLSALLMVGWSVGVPVF
ncbi:MAG: glycosyltransferase family 39 protein, partial [Mesorhizobium sp.]|nr:glycosyltransferase family 39 protein [Mesorhizobium sp.]